MLACSESNTAVSLNKPAPRMDCRVKPGNDDAENRSRDMFLCPSLADHDHAEKIRPRQKEGGEAPKGAMPTICRAHQQMSPSADAWSAAARQLGARPPSGASTAALATGYHPDGSAPEPGF